MSDATSYRWDELPREQVTPMLERRLITGDKIMLAYVNLARGCPVPRHQHHHEQITYIQSGALRFWLGEDESEERVVRAGEVIHFPSNVWHKAEAMEDSEVLDVFSPPREDWINKTDAYLREATAR
jgi:quercetin dioxygenase-like cupin family protein